MPPSMSAERAMLLDTGVRLFAGVFSVLRLPELAFMAVLLLHQALLLCFCCLCPSSGLLPSRFFLHLPVGFVYRFLSCSRCLVFLALDVADVNTWPDYRSHDDAYSQNHETEGGVILAVCFSVSDALPIVHFYFSFPPSSGLICPISGAVFPVAIQ